jgi:hypothetical protein
VGIGTASPSGRLHAVTTTNTAVNGAADAGYSLFRGTTNSSGGVLSISGNSTGNGINYNVFNAALNAYEPSNYGASQHIWKLGSTEALRLNSSGNLVLAGGTTTANGVGITFPATQSASSDANTLDDYEEGTFTPSIGGTATYSPANGTYTKIGKLVTFQMTLYVVTVGTGNQGTISGLPFANTGSSGNMMGATMNYFGDLNVSVNYLAGYIPPNSSSILMIGTTSTTASVSPLNVIKNASYLEMSGYYYTS